MRTVEQILKEKGPEFWRIAPEAPVIEALKLMAEKHIGALLVMSGESLVGILSERDYARKVVLLGRSSADTPVSQIMTPGVTTITRAA